MNNTISIKLQSIMLVVITLFLLFLLFDPLGNQFNVFFAKTDNLFADFFNVQLYISEWDPYHNTLNGLAEKNYLPIVYCFFKLFSGFYDYSTATLTDCYASTTAMFSCMMLVVFFVLLMYHSLSKLITFNWAMKFIIFFSSILLFSIERGNVILLCAAFMFYFLALKDSVDKRIRIFALVCLCLACLMKVYPAILGIYLLKEKRYKAIVCCAIFCIAFAFIPFLLLPGKFENVPQLISNVMANSETYDAYKIYPRFGLAPLFAWSFSFFHVERAMSDILLFIPRILVFISVVISLFLFFFENVQWKKLALIILPLIMFPTNSAFYCGLYFIPVILLFLSSNEGRRIDFFYMLLICVFLNPFQIGVIRSINISQTFSNIALMSMWLLLLIESANSYMARKKSLK